MFDPILLLLLAMLAASVYLAWSVIKAAKPKRPQQSRREIQKAREARDKQKSLNTRLSKNREWHQLLIRVKFDIPTAERLIEGLRRRHPDKSDRWLIEKAIYDLERDNRR